MVFFQFEKKNNFNFAHSKFVYRLQIKISDIMDFSFEENFEHWISLKQGNCNIFYIIYIIK